LNHVCWKSSKWENIDIKTIPHPYLSPIVCETTGGVTTCHANAVNVAKGLHQDAQPHIKPPHHNRHKNAQIHHARSSSADT